MRYVGLDVHKRTVRVCILDQQGRRLLGMSVPCEQDALLSFCCDKLEAEDQVVLEATTNTWAVVDLISPHVGRVVVGNPLRTKAIAAAKIKTDKVDAEVLAQLLRCEYLPDVWEPDKQTRQLRQITTVRASLVNDRTRIKNRIQSLLAQRLIRCPYATLFAKRSIVWLKSVELSEQDRFVMDQQLRLLEVAERELAVVDERMARTACDEAKVKLLMTLPGVSYATAMALLGALGDVGRFRDGSRAASYLGLAPSTHQSANHCYHGHFTKAGNSHARWMITQGVQHAARHPGPLGAFFRRVAKRKNRQVAIVATARKLVVIAYLMLKNNEPYRYTAPDLMHRKYRKMHRGAGDSSVRRATGRTYREICGDEGLPSARAFYELPAGERRMLKETRTAAFARKVLRSHPAS